MLASFWITRRRGVKVSNLFEIPRVRKAWGTDYPQGVRGVVSEAS